MYVYYMSYVPLGMTLSEWDFQSIPNENIYGCTLNTNIFFFCIENEAMVYKQAAVWKTKCACCTWACVAAKVNRRQEWFGQHSHRSVSPLHPESVSNSIGYGNWNS